VTPNKSLEHTRGLKSAKPNPPQPRRSAQPLTRLPDVRLLSLNSGCGEARVSAMGRKGAECWAGDASSRCHSDSRQRLGLLNSTHSLPDSSSLSLTSATITESANSRTGNSRHQVGQADQVLARHCIPRRPGSRRAWRAAQGPRRRAEHELLARHR
jgi:hypothetical protein